MYVGGGESMMYETYCSNPKCNKGEDGGKKKIFTYAKDRLGNLGTNYCSRFCEKEAKYEARRK